MFSFTREVGTSTTAWSMSNVQVSGGTTAYLQGQQVGNSAQLSQLAMIEASDSTSPDCLTALRTAQMRNCPTRMERMGHRAECHLETEAS